MAQAWSGHFVVFCFVFRLWVLHFRTYKIRQVEDTHTDHNAHRTENSSSKFQAAHDHARHPSIKSTCSRGDIAVCCCTTQEGQKVCPFLFFNVCSNHLFHAELKLLGPHQRLLGQNSSKSQRRPLKGGEPTTFCMKLWLNNLLGP